MRFADLDGSMIDVYQATTQMTDESGQTLPDARSTRCSTTRSGPKGYYGVFTANMHTDHGDHAERRTRSSPRRRRAACRWSRRRQMLDWLDGRNGSSFANIAYSGGQLTLLASSPTPKARGLEAMLPAQLGVRPALAA